MGKLTDDDPCGSKHDELLAGFRSASRTKRTKPAPCSKCACAATKPVEPVVTRSNNECEILPIASNSLAAEVER